MRRLLVLLVGLSACGGLIPDFPEEAAQTAGDVLAAVGEGDAATIWDQWTAPEFRESVTREGFEEIVVGLHRKLGAVQSKTRTGFHHKTGTGHADIHLTYSVVWEKGPGSAIIRLFKIDGEWKLAHLQVNSPELLK